LVELVEIVEDEVGGEIRIDDGRWWGRKEEAADLSIIDKPADLSFADEPASLRGTTIQALHLLPRSQPPSIRL
jgi:hypothetical protein